MAASGTRASTLLAVLSIVQIVPAGLVTGTAWGGVSPFTEEALERGLDFVMVGFPQPQGFDGQGAGFADLDGDGDADVIVVGSPSRRIGIFENLGGGTFVDRSVDSGIPLMLEQEGFAAADYDGDGRIDLYLTQDQKPNLLMKNLGGFQFQDVTATAGTGDDGPSTGASWGDFDGDGWLDLYVCNYSGFAPGDPPNVLYRNNGDGTFDEVGEQLGVGSVALSFQSVWSDYDRDGDLDLYVSNDRGPVGWTPNQLWRNDGGVFVDVSEQSGANVSLFSMGLAAGDFDRNLYPDFYVTDLDGNDCTSNTGHPQPTSCPDGDPEPYVGRNRLVLNLGDGSFVEFAEQAGVATYETGWGAVFFDFDNNGFKDLYVNNMWLPNSLYLNDGTFPCPEIAELAGVQASFDPSYDPDNSTSATIVSYSSAVADVDGDGAIDLLVNNVGHRAELFINHEGTERNYVRYSVVGEVPNLHAVGASIETTAGGTKQFDQNHAGGNGYLGQNELVIHVGLDAASQVDEAVVRWPSHGPTRTLTDLPANETWTIYPPSRLCDVDGQGTVDHTDFVAFSACFESGFAPGCEMMDFDGDSSVEAYDLEDCFATVSGDCNDNGTNDYLEILFDPGIDADVDGMIDCCAEGTASPPGTVGAALMLGKGPGAGAELAWEAPETDPTHDPATSYDVFRSGDDPGDGFELVANVAAPGYEDSEPPGPLFFYRVGARNGCGSSGEEPY